MSKLRHTIKSHYEALETKVTPPPEPEPQFTASAPPPSFPPQIPSFTLPEPSAPAMSPTPITPTHVPQHFDHHHPLFRSISDFDILQGSVTKKYSQVEIFQV